MKRFLAYAGWVVAAIAIVVAGYSWVLFLRDAVSVDDIKQDMARLEKLDAEHQAMIAELQQKLAALETKASSKPMSSAEEAKPQDEKPK